MTAIEPGALPPYVATGPPPARPGRVIGIGVGLAAALLAGSFAVVSFAQPTGAESPEAAVERLFAAVERSDAVGVLETLVPGERRPLQDGLQDVAGQLERLGVLDDDFDLGAVEGVALDVEGLELSSEDLGGGIAAVRLEGGTITATADPADVALGPAVRDLLDESDLEPTTETTDLAGEDDVVLVALDGGDGWHVSVWYSIAESIRRGTSEPLPPFGRGVAPEGAASPEEAVRELAEAAIALDARRAIALTPPGEMGALHDYAPLFLDDLEDGAAEFDVELSLERFDTDVEQDGEVARVALEALHVTGTADGDEIDVEFDGECVRFRSGDDEERECGDALPRPVLSTVREGGRWFVSPTRTSFDLTVAALEQLDPDDLDAEAGLFGGGFLWWWALGGLSIDESGATTELASPMGDCFGPLEELPEDPGPEDLEEANRAVEECLSEEGGSGGGWSPAPPSLSPDAVAVGDCLDDLAGPVVPCDAPHVLEAFAEVDVDRGEDAYEPCTGERFTSFVGVEYFESELFVEVLVPEAGEGRAVCLVSDGFEGTTEGSLRGAGR